MTFLGDRTHPRMKVGLLGTFVCLLVLALIAGCTQASPDPEAEGQDQGEIDLTRMLFTDYSTPENAVQSYLDWMSYAYRVTDSQVATSAMTDWEWVRVDAYLEMNRQEGRGIDQSLIELEVLGVEGSETTSTVRTHELWTYRYFGPDAEYISDEMTATYSVEYTVIRPEGTPNWLVDRVKATPEAPVE